MSYSTGHRRFKPTKKRKLSPVLLCSLLAACLLYLVLDGTATTSPVDALARAREALSNRQIESARALLSIPLSDELLTAWSSLLNGQLAEVEGKNDDAINLYRKITDESAAFLDAQVALLRLGVSPAGETPLDHLSQIEVMATRSFRTDLNEEILITRGILRKNGGDNTGAIAELNQLRKRFPQSRHIRMAKETLSEIFTKSPSLSPSASVENAVMESSLLAGENDPIAALELLQNMRATVTENSEGYFKLRLAEEPVLRKLKRNEEADHVLLLLSADAGPGIADEALLRIAKNHWNINDQGQALTFIDSLQNRFPDSPIMDDAIYAKGRILEEVEELADAKDTYSALITRTTNQLLKVRAWGRIAWLYLRGENFPYAAAQFGLMRQAAMDAIQELTRAIETDPSAANATLQRDLEMELLHAAFWEAYSLRRTENANISALPYSAPNLQDLEVILARGTSVSYYPLLAHSQLRMGSLDIGTPISDSTQCFEADDRSLVSILEPLSSGGLRVFADYEVNWHFFRLGASAQPNSAASDEDTRRALTRVRLLSTYGLPQSAVSAAEALLRSRKSGGLLETCKLPLIQFAFPTPFRSDFENAHKNSGVPLSLLYAIARTESRFDPQAISRTGAQGLMQLMPNTAKQEGLAVNEEVFLPSTNILLGAKHFRRVLEEQEQNKSYAIAAYNAGSAPVNRWKTRYEGLDPLLWVEMIGYPETKDYVKKVTSAQIVYEKLLAAKNIESPVEAPTDQSNQ